MNTNIYSPYYVDSDNQRDLDILLERTFSLGDSSRHVLLSADTPCFIQTLGLIFDLSENQSSNLSRIVRDIILGDTFIGNMTTEIEKRLNLPPETAQQIRNKIINELFAPAIEDIKKVQREKFANKIGNQLQTPAPKPPTDINPGNVVNLRDKQQ